MDLLNDDTLNRSSVVANCSMNRERTLTGPNGYARELGFHPLTELIERSASAQQANWLDLCCGSGKALVEAAEVARAQGMDERSAIVGVDLVGRDAVAGLRCLRFVEASLATWIPDRQFDIITCVHGLHYIGDKLGLICRAASWLTDRGRFAANLDLANIHIQDCASSTRAIASALRRSGFAYDSRKKLLACAGRTVASLPFDYLGADDRAGPNYTGQAAVTSHYASMAERLTS